VHERITRFGAEPDQRPLLRTMVRLRHDVIMIGRAALGPLPGAFLPRLRPHLTRISEACADYLRAGGATLSARQPPPPLDAVESALDGYAAEFAALRREGLTRELPDEAVERIFAFGLRPRTMLPLRAWPQPREACRIERSAPRACRSRSCALVCAENLSVG
jgi:hypothetical protein